MSLQRSLFSLQKAARSLAIALEFLQTRLLSNSASELREEMSATHPFYRQLQTCKLARPAFCGLAIAAALSAIAIPKATVRAEEWAFYAAGRDGRRHYIDLESVEVIPLEDVDSAGANLPANEPPHAISAAFISTIDSSIYSMTHFCDADRPEYGTYLLDGISRPLPPDSVVETARTIACFNRCLGVVPGDRDWGTEKMAEVANEFWAEVKC